MDIYDGTDWIEMDIEDLKAAIAHGASIEVAAEHLCRAGSTDDGPGNAASLGWSPQRKTRRREPARWLRKRNVYSPNEIAFSDVQSLFDHHQPGRDHRAVPRHQPLRRQPAADARRVSGLTGTGDP